jgi:hypothetical protein
MPKDRETNDMNNTKKKKKKTNLRTNQKMLTGWSKKSKDGDTISFVFFSL